MASKPIALLVFGHLSQAQCLYQHIPRMSKFLEGFPAYEELGKQRKSDSVMLSLKSQIKYCS